MAEVSRRLGARAFRICFISTSNGCQTSVFEDHHSFAFLSPLGKTYHDLVLGMPEASEVLPCKGEQSDSHNLLHFQNGKLTDVYFSCNSKYGARGLDDASQLFGCVRCRAFVDLSVQRLGIFPKQQAHILEQCNSLAQHVSPSLRFGAGRCQQRLFTDRRISKYLLQVRMYRTVSSLNVGQFKQLNSKLPSVCHRPLARPYSWKKDDKSNLPLYRSRTAYYDILKISPNATQSQVKTAYYKQSFIYHPDKNAGSEEATQRFAEISEAYMVLGSKWLRRKYDNGILTQADLQSGGKRPSKEQPTPPPSSPQRQQQYQQQRQQHAGGFSKQFGGGHIPFDFDEFFRAHYGEQLQREQDLRKRQELLRKIRQEQRERYQHRKTLEFTVSILLTCVTVIVISMIET